MSEKRYQKRKRKTPAIWEDYRYVSPQRKRKVNDMVPNIENVTL